MDTDLFAFDFVLDLEPVYQESPPQVRVTVGNQIIWQDVLSTAEKVEHSQKLPQGLHQLSVELFNKSDLDRTQALILKNLKINGIVDRKFIWTGIYRPCYPEPWASEQRQLGIDIKEEIVNVDYLGWNGVWKLNFSSPIFTWIHQIQDLGWIYD
jgi:hypothetical protein